MKPADKAAKSGELDGSIRRALARTAETVPTASEDSLRLRKTVNRRIEERTRMRKWSAKKIVVIAAAVCVFGSITAIAAGRIAGISSQSSWKEAVYGYEKIQKMNQNLKMGAKIPEKLANGYAADSSKPVHNEAKDAEGNAVETYTSLDIVYKKNGMPDLYVDAGRQMWPADEGFDRTYEHNGTAIGYINTHMRLVPPDYKPSAEEQAQVAAGTLELSYGSDQVEDKQAVTVAWAQDGIQYLITAFDPTMTAEEFAQMAGEFIDMK